MGKCELSALFGDQSVCCTAAGNIPRVDSCVTLNREVQMPCLEERFLEGPSRNVEAPNNEIYEVENTLQKKGTFPRECL